VGLQPGAARSVVSAPLSVGDFVDWRTHRLHVGRVRALDNVPDCRTHCQSRLHGRSSWQPGCITSCGAYCGRVRSSVSRRVKISCKEEAGRSLDFSLISAGPEVFQRDAACAALTAPRVGRASRRRGTGSQPAHGQNDAPKSGSEFRCLLRYQCRESGVKGFLFDDNLLSLRNGFLSRWAGFFRVALSSYCAGHVASESLCFQYDPLGRGGGPSKYIDSQ
jgi:hypothetical protein